jgi:hypothetical protein
MPAFITSRNNPRVNMVAGMVSRIISGLTTAFRNASTRATISAVVKLSTETRCFGSRYDVSNTASVEIRIRIIKFMEQRYKTAGTAYNI